MCEERRNKIERLMILEESIPKTGIFQITEKHIQSYIDSYNDLNNTKGKGLKKREYKLARKIAGINLLKINFNRGAKYNDLKAGIVYMIENPIFKDHYKIGMTVDLVSRLNQYQTYDPYRRYSVTKYQFVENRKRIEECILYHPDILKEDGEWIKKDKAIEIFASIVQR